MYKCKWCDKEFSKFGIGTHIWRKHGEGINHKAGAPTGRIPWNKGLTKDTDERVEKYSKTLSEVSKGKKRAPLSNEHREKLSNIRSRYLEEVGGGGFANIKWYKERNILNEEFILRGTWEVKVAKWLNNKNIIWIRKKYLKYIDAEGIRRTYCPDFYLPEYNRYIEVKGYYSELDKDKIERVKTQHEIKLILLFGKHIKHMGVK